MINFIRGKIKNISFLRNFIAYSLAPSGMFDKVIKNMEITNDWKNRIKICKECPDNNLINHVMNAGEIVSGKQLMHNGIQINLGSYYGPEISQLLLLNRGVHEPQEEFAFQEVLKFIRKSPTMLELGSFWAFYSMWLNQKITGAKCFMVEPDQFNIQAGIRNFKLNNMKGNFTLATVGIKNKQLKDIKQIGVDDFCNDKGIEFLDILHSDIQGFEYEMLQGAEKMISLNQIGYIFISTHSNDLHDQCFNFLKMKNFIILCSANIDETYSEDGLIVARSSDYPGPDKIEISKRVKQI